MLPTTTATLPDGTTGECVLIDNTDDSFTIDIPLDDSVIVNKIYTFSVYANPVVETTIKMSNGGTSADYIDYAIPKGWSRIRIPFTLTAKTISFTLSASKIYLYKAQAEEGNILSDWKPTTDDAENDVDIKLADYATKTEMKAAIEITSSQIELKVSKDDVISAINQTAEEITIDASKINLNGVVTANEKFKINTDGSMEATGGKFSGDITATNIYIDNKIQMRAVGLFEDEYISPIIFNSETYIPPRWTYTDAGIFVTWNGEASDTKSLKIGDRCSSIYMLENTIFKSSIECDDDVYIGGDACIMKSLSINKDLNIAGNVNIGVIGNLNATGVVATKDVTFTNQALTTKNGNVYQNTGVTFASLGIKASDVYALSIAGFSGMQGIAVPYNDGTYLRLVSNTTQTITNITIRIAYNKMTSV